MNQKFNGTRTVSSAALAVAAAGFFLSGTLATVTVEAKEAKVQCAGVNSCKGKSECSTAKNGCKGQNACKGEGWLSMSEKQCIDKGGKVDKG
jgi:hypothetical protein